MTASQKIRCSRLGGAPARRLETLGVESNVAARPFTFFVEAE